MYKDLTDYELIQHLRIQALETEDEKLAELLREAARRLRQRK